LQPSQTLATPSTPKKIGRLEGFPYSNLEGMEQTVFPFGKYKGRPINIVLRDENYCKWLLKNCDVLKKNKKYDTMRKLIEKLWGCGLCHDDSRGMY
jgi:hypothetical protein